MMEQGNSGDETRQPSVLGEISRPAHMAALPELLEFVSSVERQQGFSRERIEEIGPALGEALSRVVTEAYRVRQGDITITCGTDPWGKLVISIVDTGDPFNILLADVLFAGEEPGDEGKRASARLIKRMIDNIEYKRVEQENMLTFTVSGRCRTKR